MSVWSYLLGFLAANILALIDYIHRITRSKRSKHLLVWVSVWVLTLMTIQFLWRIWATYH